MWLNSLLPRDRHISSDLGNDLRDGFALLSALDAVLPSSVNVRPFAHHCGSNQYHVCICFTSVS